MASNPLNASVLPPMCPLSSTGCSKCPLEGISRFLVGFSLVLISVMANCCADVAQPCSQRVFSPCQGQVGTSMAWFEFRIVTYFLDFFIIPGLSTELVCSWGFADEAQVAQPSSAVQEDPGPHSWYLGILWAFPCCSFSNGTIPCPC